MSRYCSRAAVVGMLLCAASVAAISQTVTAFHGGAEHRGVYDATAGSVVQGIQWAVPTKGDIVSSPVIAGQTVYIGSSDGRLYAIDVTSGQQLWAFDAGSPVQSSAAVDERRVYFGARNGVYFAVNAGTGMLEWRFNTGKEIPLIWGHESGDYYVSSPVSADGVVVFGSGDGKVYALASRTGREIWHAQTQGRVRTSPAVSGGAVYVGSMDGRVYAFDLHTGRELWRYETEGVALQSADFGFDRRTIQSSPAVADGAVYIGSRDGGLYAIDAASGKLRWRASHGTSWIITTPSANDGKVYVGSSDGAFVQALSASDGKEVWRQKIGTVIWSSLAISGDRLFFGDRAGRICAVDRQNGELQWTFRTGDTILSSPAVAKNLIVVGSGDGHIYALRVGVAAVHRGVFADAAKVKEATFGGELLSQYLEHRGYEALDSEKLAAFLRQRIADREPSVLVFASDAPDVLASSESLLVEYLKTGGKVVWPGIPPLLWPADPATGKRAGLKSLDWAATTRLLQVDHTRAIFDSRGVNATPVGRIWGLAEHWHDGWGIDPAGVTTVLGLDEWGLAAAWARNYGGPAGTGFVRVPAGDPLSVYLAAEFRPEK
jgi:eukaryotic-like serine/threonine-protein kinase